LSPAALSSSAFSQQAGGDAISTSVKSRNNTASQRTILGFATVFMLQTDFIVLAMTILVTRAAQNSQKRLEELIRPYSSLDSGLSSRVYIESDEWKKQSFG
jgi:hypothetical protein